MATKPQFHPGVVEPHATYPDESGVAAVEFIPLVRRFHYENQKLAASIGKDASYVSGLLTYKEDGTPKHPWINLSVADKILSYFGEPGLLQTLVVIPGPHFSFARQMAYYEVLDENDQPTKDVPYILERAEELFAMRDMMLSGDPEQVAYCRELAGL